MLFHMAADTREDQADDTERARIDHSMGFLIQHSPKEAAKILKKKPTRDGDDKQRQEEEDFAFRIEDPWWGKPPPPAPPDIMRQIQQDMRSRDSRG